MIGHPITKLIKLTGDLLNLSSYYVFKFLQMQLKVKIYFCIYAY